MDFIKVSHEILIRYLGVEHRGSKQLGPEHQDLKKNVQDLITYAFLVGKANGFQEAQKHFDKYNNQCTILCAEDAKDAIQKANERRDLLAEKLLNEK